MLQGKKILLIISGGIAAYKSLDLIRRLREKGAHIRTILTAGGAQFVTPLSIASLSGEKVYTDLFSLTDEQEMGHIKLGRDTDLVLVCPASADILAKMAHGEANDLATTVMLATEKPIMVAPAMNPSMWSNPATQDNIAVLKRRKVEIIEPAAGSMACGEEGQGRLPEVDDLLKFVTAFFTRELPLKGRHAIVTSGPTYEAIDPVRFIGNRSSGKQGHAVAESLAKLGARVTLVSGPTNLPDPKDVETIHVVTADEMEAAIHRALPADIAVCAAAVSDWRSKETANQKIKKQPGVAEWSVDLVKNPDLLLSLSKHIRLRPTLVVGFAAETENLRDNAKTKLQAKGCDWLLANSVAGDDGAFGKDDNQITFITAAETIGWPMMSKRQVADMLAQKIVGFFNKKIITPRVKIVTASPRVEKEKITIPLSPASTVKH